MRSVVTGLMMLVGSVVREQGQSLDDTVWRREAQSGAPQEQTEEVQGQGEGGESEVTVVAGPPIGTVDVAGGVDRMSLDGRATATASDRWDVACTRERGGNLVFDRWSVRALDGVTLFHWTTADGTPGVDTTIHTAVADCRQKSIDASWPGKRRQTRAGTCGRHLVEAVCDLAPPGQQHQTQAAPAQR